MEKDIPKEFAFNQEDNRRLNRLIRFDHYCFTMMNFDSTKDSSFIYSKQVAYLFSFSKRPKYFLFVGLIFVLSGCAKTPSQKTPAVDVYDRPTSEVFSQFADKMIKKAMRKNKITGLSAIVFDSKGSLWSSEYGYRDRGEEALVTNKTQYQIGSLTKIITSTAIMKLQEDGKLSITDPVSKYLPEFLAGECYEGQSVTIQDLMTHESGLAYSYWSNFWTRTDWHDEYRDIDCTMVPFPPNKTHFYSNIGFTVLGNVIEKVSGLDYQSYVEKTIFLPLGMENTSFESFVNTGAILANLSKSFDMDGNIVEPSYVRDTPAGGVIASVSDLAKFARLFLASEHGVGSSEKGAIFSRAETAKKMLMPHSNPNNMALNLKVGLAWFLKTSPLSLSSYVAEHGGSTIYHHSQILLYPDRDIGIIVMANSGERHSLGGFVAELFNYATGIPDTVWQTGPSEFTPENPKPAFCSYEDALGYYHSEAGLVKLSPRKKKKGYVAELGSTKIYLKHTEAGFYRPFVKLLGFIPIGRIAFGDITISLRCENANTFAAVQDFNKHFTIAYKVHPEPKRAPEPQWLGLYQMTEGYDNYQGNELPTISLWQENGLYRAATNHFPVHYDERKFLVNRSGDQTMRLLYLGSEWGPELSFFVREDKQRVSFMGLTFTKL